MNDYEDFFLENQRDLDAEDPVAPCRPPRECKHKWKRIHITTVTLYGFELGYSCSGCGIKMYATLKDRREFDM